MSSQALQREIEELKDEIAFQNVLLGSIDDSVTDRAAAEKEVLAEIKTLEIQLVRLQRGTKAATPHNRPSTSNTSHTRFTNAENAGSADEATPNSTMDSSYNRGEQWNSLSSASSMPSTPNSADSLGGSSNRKRSYSKHLDGTLAPMSGSKSRRTSPSPFHTEPASPSLSVSSGDDELQAFDHTQYMQQQKEEEKKLARMKADEEFARQVQEETFGAGSSASSLNAQAGPSYKMFERKSSIPVRPQVPAWNSTSASSSSAPPGQPFIKSDSGSWPSAPSGSSVIKPEFSMSGMNSSFASYPSMNDPSFRVKPEPTTFAMPGSYRDDSSEADDSDIEVIPSTAFHPNGRHHDGFVPNAAAHERLKHEHGGSNTLHMALYDNKTPAWMDPPDSLGPPRPGFIDDTSLYGGGLGSSSPLYDPLDGLVYGGGSNRDAIRDHLNLPVGMNDRLDYIMNDPRNSHQEIKDLLENIRPDDDLPPENREGTPAGLVYPLYEHQKLALTWLKSMETGRNKGGILADDMGLGKTISALALILSRPSSNAICKTNLIVGPVALVRQWEREIRTKVKGTHRLSVHLLHGPHSKKMSWDDLRLHDVVLTTFGTLGAEFRRLENFLSQRRGQTYDEAPMRKLFPLLGPKSIFYRVFIDEAQCIKNKTTTAARAACHIESTYRFCLTGTPMMNNVGELYSLIHFLRIKPYNEWSRFNQDFGMLTKGSHRYNMDQAMQRLRAVLKAILLRRTKMSLIDGKPIITLPSKTEEIQHVVFSKDEQEFYKALESKTQVQFNKYMRANAVGKNYSNVLVLLLRLRQACCHPHLIQDFDEMPTDESMMALAEEMKPDVVARILEGEDAYTCPICMDAPDAARIILPCGHVFCNECLLLHIESESQRAAADDNEGVKRKCPSCRGDLAINKIIDYSAFDKVHKPSATRDADDDDQEDSDTDSDNEDSETESDGGGPDTDSRGNLKGFIVPDGISDSDDEMTKVDAEEAEIGMAEEGDDEADSEPITAKSKSKGKGKAISKAARSHKSGEKRKSSKKSKKKVHVSIAMLKKEATRSKEGRRNYMKYLKKNWQPSAKVTKCVELLGEFRDDGKKTIVFSQFVSLLDLLQVAISENKWRCLRYDGSMSGDDRNNAINKFTDNREENIMLISLKAGNAGLNLVAASRVVILDPFWNPYIEMQAVDRAYRIGQQNEVQVHRILIKETVEDRIIELQNQKRALVETALDEGANKAVSKLGVQQLAFLFGVSQNSH